jgi:hypothetical protein
MSLDFPDKLLNSFADKYVHELGTQFVAVELPEDIERGELGRCFDNSLLQVLKSKGKYRYVEGFAYTPTKKEWVHHGWMTDDTGVLAFDPTWKALGKDGKTEYGLYHAGFVYVGVVMDTQKVLDFVLDTEYCSVFEHYKKNEELAKKIFTS